MDREPGYNPYENTFKSEAEIRKEEENAIINKFAQFQVKQNAEYEKIGQQKNLFRPEIVSQFREKFQNISNNDHKELKSAIAEVKRKKVKHGWFGTKETGNTSEEIEAILYKIGKSELNVKQFFFNDGVKENENLLEKISRKYSRSSWKIKENPTDYLNIFYSKNKLNDWQVVDLLKKIGVKIENLDETKDKRIVKLKDMNSQIGYINHLSAYTRKPEDKNNFLNNPFYHLYGLKYLVEEKKFSIKQTLEILEYAGIEIKEKLMELQKQYKYEQKSIKQKTGMTVPEKIEPKKTSEKPKIPEKLTDAEIKKRLNQVIDFLNSGDVIDTKNFQQEIKERFGVAECETTQVLVTMSANRKPIRDDFGRIQLKKLGSGPLLVFKIGGKWFLTPNPKVSNVLELNILFNSKCPSKNKENLSCADGKLIQIIKAITVQESEKHISRESTWTFDENNNTKGELLIH